MSLVIPDGYAQITYLFGGAGMPNGAATTIGVSNTADLDLEAINTAAKDAYDAGLDMLVSAFCVLTGIRVKLGPVSTGPVAEFPYNLNGSATGAQAPPNVATLVRKLTATGGRQGRGRMYVPGATEPDLDEAGRYNTSYTAVLQGHVDAFAASLATDLLIPVLFHDEAGPVTVPTEITSLQVDGLAATQRRRMRS